MLTNERLSSIKNFLEADPDAIINGKKCKHSQAWRLFTKELYSEVARLRDFERIAWAYANGAQIRPIQDSSGISHWFFEDRRTYERIKISEPWSRPKDKKPAPIALTDEARAIIDKLMEEAKDA
jgi:hypothetical protein